MFKQTFVCFFYFCFCSVLVFVVSADMSSGLLQVFVKLGNLYGTSNYVRNVVEITIKMKTIVRKPLMIKINKLRLRNLDN